MWRAGSLREDSKPRPSIDATDHESVVEVSYRIVVSEILTLVPDVQLVSNPGFDRTINDAMVLGFRVEVTL